MNKQSNSYSTAVEFSNRIQMNYKAYITRREMIIWLRDISQACTESNGKLDMQSLIYDPCFSITKRRAFGLVGM